MGTQVVNEVMDLIAGYDKEVGEAIQAECARQRRNLELIASENIVSEPVMMAMGTVLTNKYAEGYPGKRYYGGCQCVDVVENLAIERAGLLSEGEKRRKKADLSVGWHQSPPENSAENRKK